MRTKTEWAVSDLASAKLVGRNNYLEFKDCNGEWQTFEVLQTKDRLIFGGSCNVGFLESGYILREDFETLDETLQELLSDLEAYYNDGPQYVSRIVVNERM